jgi:hypothetical protein
MVIMEGIMAVKEGTMVVIIDLINIKSLLNMKNVIKMMTIIMGIIDIMAEDIIFILGEDVMGGIGIITL